MAEFKQCPCGQTPKELYISEGSTYRWRYVEGDCGCGWMIEVRVNTMRERNTQLDHQECAEAWDDMPRQDLRDEVEDQGGE